MGGDVGSSKRPGVQGDAMADIRTMRESKYIAAWDLRGKDHVVTISKIVAGIVEGEAGRKDKAPIVTFKGARKPLVLNATGIKVLFSLFGTYEATTLAGKRITLYPTTCKAKGGGMVDCVRIRPVAPGVGAQDTSSSLDEPVDEAMQQRQKEQAGEREPGEEG
jgi:hypothetical protein